MNVIKHLSLTDGVAHHSPLCSPLCSAGIVLCLDGANERRRYIKRRPSLSGPMHVLNSTQNRTENLS